MQGGLCFALPPIHLARPFGLHRQPIAQGVDALLETAVFADHSAAQAGPRVQCIGGSGDRLALHLVIPGARGHCGHSSIVYSSLRKKAGALTGCGGTPGKTRTRPKIESALARAEPDPREMKI
jgi:hypothetical protein